MLSVTCKPYMLSVVKLGIVKLNAVMLSVVAPCGLYYKHILTSVSDDRK